MTQKSESRGDNRTIRVSKTFIGLLGLYWLVIFLRGYPEPWSDDTFYVGTAIHFAKFGKLWNAMTPGLLERFSLFPYPPLYSWTLGHWLQIVGISTPSLLAFHGILNYGTSLSITTILRKFNVSYYVIIGVIILYTTAIFDMGLRPNAFAYHLLIGAAACFLRGGDTGRFFAWVLLGLSLVALPYLLVFVVPLVVGGVFWKYTQDGDVGLPTLLKDIGILTVAVVVDFIIFGKCIDFQYAAWIKSYFYVASLNATPFSLSSCIEGWKLVGHFLKNGWNPILFGPGYLLAVCSLVHQVLNWKGIPLEQRIITAVFFFGMTGAGILYSVFFIQILPYATLVYALVVFNMKTHENGGFWKPVVRMLPFLCVPLAICLKLIPFFYQKSDEAVKIEAIRAYVRAHPEKRYVVSSDAWRYVFDYRAPEGTLAAEWCVPQSEVSWVAHIRTMSWKKEGDVWIMSAYHLQQFIPDSGIQFTPIRVGPVTLKSIRMYRNEILLMP